MSDPRLQQRFWIVFCVALCSLLFLIRITGPDDLSSYDQGRTIGLLLDLIKNGHWLVQQDLQGRLFSAPPMHTWILASFTALFGLNRLALTLPSFLSVLALTLLLFQVGRRRFGDFGQLAGGLTVVAFLLAPTMAKQVALVGSGPLLTLAITLTALAAFRAGEDSHHNERKWMLFWGMAAITALFDGPFGVVLAAGGLLSRLLERTNENDHDETSRQSLHKTSQAKGVILFLAILVGWFAAAWFQKGHGLVDAILLPGGYGEPKGATAQWLFTQLLTSFFSLLIRYLPFSLPLLIALWRVVRHPATNLDERRFERFLACWLLCAILVISLSEQQRPDDLLPLWPAGALLAGREMARFARKIGETRFAGIGMVIGIILLGATYAAVHSPAQIAATRDLRPGADALLATGIDARKLWYIETPASLQLYLATYQPIIDRDQLQQLLKEETGPVDIALAADDIGDLHIASAHRDVRLLFRWPDDASLPPVLQVFRIGQSAEIGKQIE